MVCSVAVQRQESPNGMWSTQRRARVDVEAGKLRRKSLVHDDARPASRAGDGAEVGGLHGTCAPHRSELTAARRQANPDSSRLCATTLGQRAASEAQHSGTGPTRHDTLGARLPALPGMACWCPLPVMCPLLPSRVIRPMPSFCVVRPMTLFHVVQPSPLGRRLQALPVCCLR